MRKKAFQIKNPAVANRQQRRNVWWHHEMLDFDPLTARCLDSSQLEFRLPSASSSRQLKSRNFPVLSSRAPNYAELPRYDELLAQRDFNDSYELPQNLNVHPDTYLPYYHDQDSVGDTQTEEEISNLSDEQNNEVDMAVAQRVAERTVRRQPPGRVFLSPGYATSGEYTTDLEPLSHASFMDDMSMSVGGYTSNASCSDISGLCEIEDSEINASENEEDNDENTPCLSPRIHTEV